MKTLRVSIMLACAATALAWSLASRPAAAAPPLQSAADSVIAADERR